MSLSYPYSVVRLTEDLNMDSLKPSSGQSTGRAGFGAKTLIKMLLLYIHPKSKLIWKLHIWFKDNGDEKGGGELENGLLMQVS